MTQEQKQEFTRRISQENHSGLILVLCDIFHTYGMDAMAAYEAENMTTYLQSIGQARRTMQELIDCFSGEDYHFQIYLWEACALGDTAAAG